MKVTYESCTVYVLGLDLNCPMCGVLVPSGVKHACSGLAKMPAKKGTPK